ncbi:hypothetical protein D3C85_1163050 [compost metagenome]
MLHQGQGADELGAALGVRHVLQCLQQLGVVGRIAETVGVARRADARGAAEGVHRQARVVGQRRQAGHPCGVAGLEDGVLDEAQAGFLRLVAAELGHRAHAHGVAQHGLQFLELAGVVAGQYQFGQGFHSSGNTSWLKVRLWVALPSCTLRSKVSTSRSFMLNCAR